MSAKIIVYFLFLTILFVSKTQAEELKIEEVIAKHTNSIGTLEKRKGLSNMMLLGFSQFESKLPERKSVGKLAVVSNSSNLLFISSFASESYPFEKIGNFDGKIVVPFVSSGIRSPLGDFLIEHPNLLKSGLFSGTMSLNWNMLANNLEKGKYNLSGTKKINGRKAYTIEFLGGGNAESFTVRMYFDAETFQHVQSEYRESYSGKQAKFGTLGEASDYTIELKENFSEFKTFDGITLPTVYNVHFESVTSKSTFVYDWVFKVNDVKFNQTLKDGFFNF